MHKVFTALVLMVISFFAFAGSAEELTLDVMSFNIRYGTAKDGKNHWSLRRSLVLDVMRQEAPAVLGLQEALRFQLDEIREALPD